MSDFIHTQPCHLKLVASNPPPIQKNIYSQTTEPNTDFIAEIQIRSHLHYVLIARDDFHCLACDLVMEIEEIEEEGDMDSIFVTCHFPCISDEQLSDFVDDDDDLMRMILVDFQMKIMEQLLLFCITQNASTLLIQVDVTPEGDALGIYREVVTHEDKIYTQEGKFIQLTIPSNFKTYKSWTYFMKEINARFSKTLWQEKSENPAMRQYIKSRALLKDN